MRAWNPITSQLICARSHQSNAQIEHGKKPNGEVHYDVNSKHVAGNWRMEQVQWYMLIYEITHAICSMPWHCHRRTAFQKMVGQNAGKPARGLTKEVHSAELHKWYIDGREKRGRTKISKIATSKPHKTKDIQNCPWRYIQIPRKRSTQSINKNTKATIQIAWTLVLQSTIPAPPNPPSLFPLFPCIAVPAILVKLFADAFNVAWSSKGLLRESQAGRVLSSGIEFVTLMGRSKIVYISIPFNRKFWRMEIYSLSAPPFSSV